MFACEQRSKILFFCTVYLQICVKSLNGLTSTDTFLPSPHCPLAWLETAGAAIQPTELGHVHRVAISRSGLFVAALVHSSLPSGNSEELLLHLMVWVRSVETNGWRCVGGTGLAVPKPKPAAKATNSKTTASSSPQKSVAASCGEIDWLSDDSLVLVLPMPISDRIKGQEDLLMTFLPSVQLLNGNIGNYIQRNAIVTSGMSTLAAIRAVPQPGNSEGETSSVVILSESKTSLISYNRRENTTKVVWSDVSGNAAASCILITNQID